ncbi:MAG: hypothetical protein WD651_15185 [Acidimicrobiia bacterium]|jgi:hypothetical protein
MEIPREVADAARVPEDLDSASLGPYHFPDPGRRRIGAYIYAGLALVGLLVIPGPGRFGFVAVVLMLALWHWRASWPLLVTPEQALGGAATVAPFPIGHSSAAVTFHGIRARPRWHVILYDAANPPAQRALMVIDAVTGEMVGEPYVEELSLEA